MFSRGSSELCKSEEIRYYNYPCNFASLTLNIHIDVIKFYLNSTPNYIEINCKRFFEKISISVEHYRIISLIRKQF